MSKANQELYQRWRDLLEYNVAKALEAENRKVPYAENFNRYAANAFQYCLADMYLFGTPHFKKWVRNNSVIYEH